MLDVHSPEHKIQGVRDFLLHIATITVGLLIALGLENAAEAMHHRSQRREAEANILQELRKNREALQAAAPVVLGERDNLVHLLATLEALSAGQSPELHGISINFSEAPIPDAAWRTASSTGVLEYMDYTEVQRFADAYKEQSMLQEAEEKALDDYLEFTPVLESTHQAPTAKQATEALPLVRRASAHVNGMLALGAGTLQSYNEALK